MTTPQTYQGTSDSNGTPYCSNCGQTLATHRTVGHTHGSKPTRGVLACPTGHINIRVAELALDGHKYHQSLGETAWTGWRCICGYPRDNHPDECFR